MAKKHYVARRKKASKKKKPVTIPPILKELIKTAAEKHITNDRLAA